MWWRWRWRWWQWSWRLAVIRHVMFWCSLTSPTTTRSAVRSQSERPRRKASKICVLPTSPTVTATTTTTRKTRRRRPAAVWRRPYLPTLRHRPRRPGLTARTGLQHRRRRHLTGLVAAQQTGRLIKQYCLLRVWQVLPNVGQSIARRPYCFLLPSRTHCGL